MSNDRVLADVKRDHIHLMNTLFRWDGSKWVAQPDVFFNTPGIEVDMGNFVGALNKSEREQYPPPVPPPVVVPPPTGAPWDWPVTILSPLWGAELRATLSTRAVTAIPIDPPVSGEIYLSCAEFASPACTRQVCFSSKAGDFANPISNIGSGNTASMDVTVVMGERVYFNVRFWSPDRNMPSTDADSVGVVIGGNWPM